MEFIDKLHKVKDHFGPENQAMKYAEELVEFSYEIKIWPDPEKGEKGIVLHQKELRTLEFCDKILLEMQIELFANGTIDGTVEVMKPQAKFFQLDLKEVWEGLEAKLDRTIHLIETVPGYGVM